MKRCYKCGSVKPVDDFYKNRTKRDGLADQCKPCTREYIEAYRVGASRPRRLAQQREYHRRNPDRSRRAQLKKYGLTIAEYDALLAAQGGACAICGSDSPGPGSFRVDHDHACCPGKSNSCGKCIRGLLCNNCNAGLGWFGDDPDRMYRAATYVLQQSDLLKGMS